MRTRNRFRDAFPITMLFITVSIFTLTGKSIMQRWNMDDGVLIRGNVLLFVITFFSFLLAEKGLEQKNPHAFIRSVYSSIMIKFFVCIIAAFVYISMNKTNINKPSLFTCMGLYLV